VLVVFGEDFPVRWSDQTAVVRLPAEIDLTIADALREALLAVLNQGAARRAAAGSATMRIAVTAPPVLRVFNLVGIDRLIDIHPSVAAALASLPDQTGGLVR